MIETKKLLIIYIGGANTVFEFDGGIGGDTNWITPISSSEITIKQNY